jgi:hypothetical protein
MGRDDERDEHLSGNGDSRPPDVVSSAVPIEDVVETNVERPAPATPHIAVVDSLWSRPVRAVVLAVIVVASLGYALFGTVLARNVTYNMSGAIDPGASNGIPRYSRETIASIWQTMWDKAPDFGSVDAIRIVLVVATLLFFMAFAVIITLIFVPARQEWTASFGESQESE